MLLHKPSPKPNPKVKPQLQKPKPHLPRTEFLCRCWKYHTCHANRAWVPESATPATQKAAAPNQHLFVAKLPRTRQCRYWKKCDTCHANRAWVPESATPATQKAAAPNQHLFVAKLPQTSMQVLKVPHLPRKSSLSCRKCHACHAKGRGAKSVPVRRHASAGIYAAPESATTATQKPAAPNQYLFVAKLPRTFTPVPKTRRLPRMSQRRQISSCSSPSFPAHLYILQILNVPRLPRKSSARSRKCHACHAIEPELPKVPRAPRERQRRQISTCASPSFCGQLRFYCMRWGLMPCHFLLAWKWCSCILNHINMLFSPSSLGFSFSFARHLLLVCHMLAHPFRWGPLILKRRKPVSHG